MNIEALIVEQLDENGALRTFRMAPDDHRRMWVAFADEYAEPRDGPFHFLDPDHAHDFEQGFATAQVRHAGPRRFRKEGSGYHFETSWQGIPTDRSRITYYALSLPEFAIPRSIETIDPHSGRQYRKNVTRDDENNRFVIYLECRSSRGVFDFAIDINCDLDRDAFPTSDYTDENTSPFGRQIDDYQQLLPSKEAARVQQFFTVETLTMNSGDNYNINGPTQAGGIGRNVDASNTTFHQVVGGEALDLPVLASELSGLCKALQERATESDQFIALDEIAAAEKDARTGNEEGVRRHLMKAGKWAFDVARDIGVNVVAAAISASMQS